MKLQKLPVGIQTFKDIREENYLYIDKTGIAYDLIDNYRYVFLSRPRRFGKSLFMDTIHNIFEGNKEYFKGLAIESKWDWDIKYPVISLIMNDKFLMLNELEVDVSNQLIIQAIKYKIELKKEKPCFMLSRLLRDLHQKFERKVALLIDDADKPFRNKLLDTNVKDINDFLLGLYIVTKESDKDIKFSMMTGIYPIKGDYFSGFNNFTDISLDKRYGDICGFTQKELEDNLSQHLELNIHNSKLKQWYNGYNFLKSDMYNPFDILKFIKYDFVYDNYWFESGTPTFLIKLIKQNNYFLPNLSELVVDKKLLSSFDIENLDLEVILYQAGYLTIKKVEIDEDEDILYTLEVPNQEVKVSLNKYIIANLFKNNTLKAKSLSKALRKNSLEEFKDSLVSIFASIPYNNYTKNDIQNYEGFYASIVYVYLQSLGLDIIGEDVTNKGRIDLTIIMDDVIYILEFKVGNSDALKQIKERNYHQKYLDKNKDIYLIGINFDEKEKNISKFEWEKIC